MACKRCLVCVLTVSGRCLKGVWRVSVRFPKGNLVSQDRSCQDRSSQDRSSQDRSSHVGTGLLKSRLIKSSQDMSSQFGPCQIKLG